MPRGAPTRVTSPNLKGVPQWLYDRVYCARSDRENRIKEQQLDLFANCASCHSWWPNQYRLLLSTLAYVLLEAIRRRRVLQHPASNHHSTTSMHQVVTICILRP